MAPSSFPRGSIEEITSRTLFPHINFLSEDCPIGTIPITRPRKRKYYLPGASSSTSIDAQDNIIQPLISYVSFNDVILSILMDFFGDLWVHILFYSR